MIGNIDIITWKFETPIWKDKFTTEETQQCLQEINRDGEESGIRTPVQMFRVHASDLSTTETILFSACRTPDAKRRRQE